MIKSDQAPSHDGILTVWNDCAAGHEALYEKWYQHEHLPERLSITGFLRGRRYEYLPGGTAADESARQFFTYYETRATEVLVSPEYRARLNAPSALTTQIMSGIFTNMSRTVCRCVRRCDGSADGFTGGLRGSFALTAILAPDQLSHLSEWPDLGALCASPGTARVEVWLGEPDNAEPSAEEKLRGGDERIGACVFVETLRQADLKPLMAQISQYLPGVEIRFASYRLLCELQAAV